MASGSGTGSLPSFMRQIYGKTNTDHARYQVGVELGRGTYGRVYICMRLSDRKVSHLLLFDTRLLTRA